MAIEYLKDHLLDTLQSKSKTSSRVDITVKDVHFVITVPAIWDDKAKLIMREAAMEVNEYLIGTRYNPLRNKTKSAIGFD